MEDLARPLPRVGRVAGDSIEVAVAVDVDQRRLPQRRAEIVDTVHGEAWKVRQDADAGAGVAARCKASG